MHVLQRFLVDATILVGVQRETLKSGDRTFRRMGSTRMGLLPIYLAFLILSCLPSTHAMGWQLVQTDGIPDARHESCFVWHEGNAYLIGGRGNPFVSVYNPRIRKWTNHSITSRRDIHHSQCVSLNGKIWFPNAWRRGFPNELNTEYLATYDPQTQIWDTTTHPALPVSRRRGGGATVVYQGKIYTSHGNSGT